MPRGGADLEYLSYNEEMVWPSDREECKRSCVHSEGDANLTVKDGDLAFLTSEP